jgi:hypothetical protein
MDYELDRRLRLITEPDFKNLYSWAIIEVDNNGKKLGRDQIPWGWSISFIATELVLSDQLTIKEAVQIEGRLPQREENSQRRVIRAKLRPGDPRNDVDWRRPKFSMFGTDRVITDFGLDVLPLESEDQTEVCTAWGTPTYQYEEHSQDDCVTFYLQLRPSTFARYVQRIAEGTAEEVVLAVGMVSGFYADWSPDIRTRAVKVLTSTKEQAVEMEDAVEFEPPRLGKIGEVELYVSARREQPKKPAAADDDDDDDDDEPSPLARPEATIPAPVELGPATAKLLRSLQRGARWIIGLLVILVVAVLVKR